MGRPEAVLTGEAIDYSDASLPFGNPCAMNFMH
jgi:hypothetical protein